MPVIASCGANQNTDIGATTLFWWWDFTIFILFDSTRADKAMLTTVSKWPIPTRRSGVRELRMHLFNKGNRTRSVKVMVMHVEINVKTTTEPAGILKWDPKLRSIFRAWRIAKLACMTSGVYRNKPVVHSGKSFINILRSSTCCTVHSFQGSAMRPSCFLSPSVTKAARFRNLLKHKISKFNPLLVWKSFHLNLKGQDNKFWLCTWLPLSSGTRIS